MFQIFYLSNIQFGIKAFIFIIVQYQCSFMLIGKEMPEITFPNNFVLSATCINLNCRTFQLILQQPKNLQLSLKNKKYSCTFCVKMYHVVNTTNQVCSRSITETQKQNFLFKLLRTITRRIKPMNVVYIDRLYICIVDDDVSFF